MKIPLVNKNRNDGSVLSDGEFYVHYNETEPFGNELDDAYNNNAYWISKIANVYSNAHHAQILPSEQSAQVPLLYIGANDLVNCENDKKESPGNMVISHFTRTHVTVNGPSISYQYRCSPE